MMVSEWPSDDRGNAAGLEWDVVGLEWRMSLRWIRRNEEERLLLDEGMNQEMKAKTDFGSFVCEWCVGENEYEVGSVTEYKQLIQG
ncbi:hypothetical protein DEO72_LG10g2575 [Vigna unguiculata]|uniref:Uncharacterized protein n=1 Tax=Vigna unguiculata TaxID=3917 RepID=A0A4D6NEL7_VIGUN|nr:hypothetical protein DEO72_LG10g2575 [Vigna unguiculata]